MIATRRFRGAWVGVLLATLAASALIGGCGRKKGDDGTTPASAELPALTLKDDTKDLLLTWIDERGDFHTTQAIADVPVHARDAVRVVVTTKDEGSVTDQVYVANLMEKRPDGTYDVRSMTRASWDALGAKHRKPLPGTSPAGSGKGPNAGAAPGEAKAGGVVVIYGASWCGPCHQAQAYLEAKKVKVVYKDIEAEPAAEAEMQKKLEAAGKRGGTIPVIDVGGRIMVGFRPGALDEAVAAMNAKGTELLIVSGIVYLIGAGPGDPGLITVRGRDLLKRCDVVLYDALAHPALLDHCRDDAEIRYVGKRGGEDSITQDAINRELVALGAAGKVVGRLKGGDPLLFARGAEEALCLAEAGIPFEIVPGVSSPVAVAAYAGIPLTHRDHASSVLFLTGTAHPGTGPDGHDWQRLATRAGTICVLMGMARLAEIADTLIAFGRPASTPTAVVEWGSRPEQRTVVAPLHEIARAAATAKIGSPAVIVIGSVVGLRDKLAWFERRPLFGRRIVLTRARDQVKDLAETLRELGADVLSFPTIAIHPPSDPAPLTAAIAELRAYDYVAFTSPNGVTATFGELARQRRDARAFGAAKIAAIGPGTERALATFAMQADVVASEFRGEGLAAAILDDHAQTGHAGGPRVLLPRARVARDALPRAIRDAGGTCTVVEAYETRAPDPSRAADLRARLEAGEIDALTVTSSSTIEHLVRSLGDDAATLLARTRLISIGPVTTETATKLGVPVARTAVRFCAEGLVEALLAELSVKV